MAYANMSASFGRMFMERLFRVLFLDNGGVVGSVWDVASLLRHRAILVGPDRRLVSSEMEHVDAWTLGAVFERLREEGVGLAAIQLVAGHRKLTTAQRYLGVGESHTNASATAASRPALKRWPFGITFAW